MNASQWQDWLTFNRIQPQGEYRAELRHGAMSALMCNLQRNPETKPEPWKPIDFMHFHEKPKEKQLTPEEIEAALTGIFGA